MLPTHSTHRGGMSRLKVLNIMYPEASLREGVIEAKHIKVANYNLDMKTRVLNRRTNLGKMYLEKTYIITISKVKVKAT